MKCEMCGSSRTQWKFLRRYQARCLNCGYKWLDTERNKRLEEERESKLTQADRDLRALLRAEIAAERERGWKDYEPEPREMR